VKRRPLGGDWGQGGGKQLLILEGRQLLLLKKLLQ